jgi:hypothetical protein
MASIAENVVCSGRETVSIVENVICSLDTMLSHPELYHYTNQAAFEGIVRSQALWCSHYGEMLDTDEIRLMRNLLPQAIAPRMDAIIEKLNLRLRQIWNSAGGGAKIARDLVNSLYGAIFDGEAAYSALDPYLFSFSTHAADGSFDREHGIRCQWERYATFDGYCLVFDINDIAKMLQAEGETRFWSWLMLEPVRYADRKVEEIFPELIYAAADTLRQFVGGIMHPEMQVSEFLRGTTLLKGAVYESEREIRIVAVPGSTEIAKYAAQQHRAEFNSTVPLPEIRLRSDCGKRYVALFDGLGQRLPIKRVIVGPGGQQVERALHARSILGKDIPITNSKCR